ncbi:MAG: DUF2752 domain-containing protein [Sphingobacteriia bacterium]
MSPLHDKKVLKWIAIATFSILFILVYKKYNPGETAFFPECPFKQATGLKCAGCGSQRAIHHLLNFDTVSALKQNALLVLFIPYTLLCLTFDCVKSPSKRTLNFRKLLFGPRAIFIILSIIILFWVSRNLI